ncbi:growth inhibitor PemK [Erwinia typographi]|uniref:Growth inhibitor PemK n=1 Tax=Erwinia typographi TaxID=371042 RepID=A0A0A3ZC32_9GAMM|nr:type II toxin-antitoxin system PemK/MazF family toxin [Erwinia typographi]KGT95364.1 growth inhibitor PemK [Erwinia typographi]
MNRGDFVTVAMQGDFGKPRPALVIQADQFSSHTSVTLLPVTGTIINAPLLRITVAPDTGNGLEKPSQVMIDKAFTSRREKIGPVFGHIHVDTLIEVERCLAVFLGIAK